VVVVADVAAVGLDHDGAGAGAVAFPFLPPSPSLLMWDMHGCRFDFTVDVVF
jgi:hypothetical protein